MCVRHWLAYAWLTVGIQRVLRDWGPRLARDRPGAVLVTTFMNMGSMQLHRTPKTFQMKCQRIRRVGRLLDALPEVSDPRLRLFRMTDVSCSAVCDLTPELEMHLHELGAIAQAKRLGLGRRARNTVHPYRRGVPLGAPHCSLPHRPPATTDTRSSGKTYNLEKTLRANMRGLPDVNDNEGLSWDFAMGATLGGLTVEWGVLADGGCVDERKPTMGEESDVEEETFRIPPAYMQNMAGPTEGLFGLPPNMTDMQQLHAQMSMLAANPAMAAKVKESMDPSGPLAALFDVAMMNGFDFGSMGFDDAE